ncbi:hypothetical protein [Pollutibacter soli]|uniref:hypothetical protein n=1 Tax=Pollutibacter soli TaxID=3034157 RepID=UPI00301393C3
MEIFQQKGVKNVFIILAIIIALYWVVAFFTNVYSLKILDAIYEILWLPTLLLTFIIPVFSFIIWAGEKFKLKSAYLFSLLLSVITILLISFVRP